MEPARKPIRSSKTPETVQPSPDLLDNAQEKTRDGRILRQSDEDPELRADDSVMVEMTSLDDMCNRNRRWHSEQQRQSQ